MAEDEESASADLDEFSDYEREGTLHDHSRSRGFLTETERKFLVGQLDHEGQQARNTRYRIREHTIDGLLDAALIARNFRPAEYEQILEKERLNTGKVPQHLVNLAYSLILFRTEHSPENPIELFEETIEEALRRAHPYEAAPNEPGVVTRRAISVDIDLNDFNLEDTENRVKTGDATPNEMLFYYELSQKEPKSPEDSLSDVEFDQEIVEKIGSQLSEIKSLSDFNIKE